MAQPTGQHEPERSDNGSWPATFRVQTPYKSAKALLSRTICVTHGLDERRGCFPLIPFHRSRDDASFTAFRLIRIPLRLV
jgi:hypothetical protein